MGPLLLLIRRRPAGVAPHALVDDLVDAVQAWLTARLVAPAGPLTWAGAGALPPGLGMPYAVIGDLDEEPDYQEDGSGHAPYDDHGSFPILVMAATRSEAKALSRLVADALTLPPLSYADGDHLMVRPTSRGAPVLDDDDAPGGRECWIAHLMFAAITSKNL